MGQAELLQQVTTIRLQGGAVAAEEGPEPVHELVSFHPAGELFDGLDERRVADDASLAVDDVGELVEGLHAVSSAGLGHGRLATLGDPPVELGLHLLEQCRGVHPRVPHIQIGHPRELTHRRPVAAHDVQHDLLAFLGRVAVVAASDREARREPFHVPFPRAGVRLVEVVDVEHQPAVR